MLGSGISESLMNKGGTEVTVFMIAQSVTPAESLQVLAYKDYALIIHLLVSCILGSLMESLPHQLTVHSEQRLCIKNITKCTQMPDQAYIKRIYASLSIHWYVSIHALIDVSKDIV